MSEGFKCDSELLHPQDGVIFVLNQGVRLERPVAKALEAKEASSVQRQKHSARTSAQEFHSDFLT